MTGAVIKKHYQDMVAYGESIQSKKFTVTEFTGLLRGFVGTEYVRVRTVRDKSVNKNQIVIRGNYDPEEDAADLPPIMLSITYNPDQKKINMRDIDWPQLCLDLIECSGHEIIHQTQYRSRGYDIGPNIFVSLSTVERKRTEKECLGSPDEVEAYGYSIAIEVYLKYSPKIIKPNQIYKTSMFKLYSTTFGKDHSVVKSLLSFIVKYYEAISEGNHAEKSEEFATE